MAYWAAGDREKSRPPFTRALQIAEAEAARNPNAAQIRADVAVVCLRLGRAAEAQANISSALALAPADATILYQAGVISVLLGQKQPGLEYLRSSLAHGYPKDHMRRDPDLLVLKNEPGFRALIQ